jgi:regulator of nucleoside diphosphate kinase
MSHAIIVTDLDLTRLRAVIDQHDVPAAELLDAELHRAVVVPRRAVPPDVVTMNSDVIYQDEATGARRTVRVVYPRDADAGRGWVSVLAPIGSALLGLRVGQHIDWPLPTGPRRLRVVAVPYQPEASGDLRA